MSDALATSALAVAHPQPELQKPASPVLKWAGGKTRLMGELLSRLPEQWTGYYEPFVGGGALFFNLGPTPARISDLNEDLINVYTVVREQVEALMAALGGLTYDRDTYYGMRGLDPETLEPVERAARMIYLNRTCFNGLYRVNRRGQFNVPMGRYRDPVICQTERLLAASARLEGVEIVHAGYGEAVAGSIAGDFIYFDPPYQPLSATANFTSYTAGAFDEADQAELAATFTALGERGVQCMLSNSDTPLIRDLYEGHRIDQVMAPRAISRNAAGRTAVAEVLVRNY
jgi:DNA adenine methylase